MKRIAAIVLVVLCMLSFAAMGAYAENSGPDVSAEASGTAPDAAAQDAMGPYNDWETNGYPDDVGGVYYDSDTGNTVITLVNASEARKQQILAMFGNPGKLSFGESRYSYNEMRTAQKEIEAEMADVNKKIYGVGIGWTTIDGKVTGFGESGKEFRVVVMADKSVFDEIARTYAGKYGDMVYVEVSGPISTTEAVKTESNTWLFPVVVTLLILASFLIVFLNHRRLIPVMQTTKGGTVTGSVSVSRKQTVAAVKSSGHSPDEKVFDAIMEQIDGQGK